MKSILITTDFSSNSKSGIHFGLQLAKQSGAQVTFFYVDEVAQPISWSDRHYKDFQKHHIDRYVKEMKGFVSAFTSEYQEVLSNAIYLVESNLDVSAAIITAAKKRKADVICTGTRGAGAFKKYFGTNSSSLVTNSPVPVVVVPAAYKVKLIDTVLYSCDIDDINREARKVKDFADAINARVKILHYSNRLQQTKVAEKLMDLATRFTADNVEMEIRKLNVEQTYLEALEKDIQKMKPELLVLFTKQNRRWYDRIMNRSRTAEISFHSKYPLLAFRKR